MFLLCRACVEQEQQEPWLERSNICPHTDAERMLRGTWTTLELQKAVEKGYNILKIHEVWHGSLCRLMVRALLLMFLSLVYRRDPFLARCYIQCTHPLLARVLDVIKCSITLMLVTLSYILRSGGRLFLI